MNSNKINFFILNFEKMDIGKVKCPMILKCKCQNRDVYYCCSEKYLKCIEYQIIAYGLDIKGSLILSKHKANSLVNKAVAENCLKKIGESEK